MVELLQISNVVNGKILVFPKNRESAESIQNFLKELKISKDYRKHFLKGEFYDDLWVTTSTKSGDIMVCSFLTANKLFLQVVFFSEAAEKFAIETIMKCF